MGFQPFPLHCYKFPVYRILERFLLSKYFRYITPSRNASWSQIWQIRRNSMLFPSCSFKEGWMLDFLASIRSFHSLFSACIFLISSMFSPEICRAATGNTSSSSPCSLARPHWVHGNLDRASALVWRRPLRWMISNSNCCSFSSHRATCPSGSLVR